MLQLSRFRETLTRNKLVAVTEATANTVVTRGKQE